jgi:hypothetical protein
MNDGTSAPPAHLRPPPSRWHGCQAEYEHALPKTPSRGQGPIRREREAPRQSAIVITVDLLSGRQVQHADGTVAVAYQ